MFGNMMQELPRGGTPYYYMKASAYISSAKASESWLISPEVDLSTATTATLTFMHIINHAGDMQTQQTLWVTETSAENWQQVTIPNYPAGNNWTEVSQGILIYLLMLVKKSSLPSNM